MTKPTRLFFVADLHGSERCFRKFVNAAPIYKADVILVGGDIAAKTITPLFPADGGWGGAYLGGRRVAHSSDEVEGFESDLRAVGTIPFRTTAEEWNEVQSHREKADALFRKLALESLTRWLLLAEARLHGSGVRTLMGLGNDDFDEMEPVLAASQYVELTHDRLVRVGEHEILTLPYSNPTPWKTSRELSEAEIERRLLSQGQKLERPSRAIFNTHVPPIGTALDLAPKLDSSLTKIITPGGEPELVHVGSTAVRKAIEQLRPLVGLHGHIHESKGFTTLGGTLCLNPGSAYSEGVLQGAILDLEPDRVRTHVLTTG